jgi:hypothetical protein
MASVVNSGAWGAWLGRFRHPEQVTRCLSTFNFLELHVSFFHRSFQGLRFVSMVSLPLFSIYTWSLHLL